MEKITSLTGRTYRHFMHDSLYRNSILLIMNMAVTAVTTFGFWIFAAHLFSTVKVGKATSLYSAVSLIGALSSFGLTRTSVRFLSKAKDRSADIITKVVISAVSAIFFAIIASFFLPYLKIEKTTFLVVALLCIASITFTLKALLDSIFIAFRASSNTFLENSIANFSKLLFLPVLVSIGYLGIFISQIAGAALALIVGIYLLKFRHGINIRRKPSLTTMSGLWSFSIGSYLNDLVGGLPSTVIPLIIIAKIGPSNSAYWYISMQIATVLFLVSSSVNQSLFAEAAHNESELIAYTKKAAAIMFGIVIPISLVIILAAPLILGFFGANYRLGVTALRLLALSSLLVAGNYITGTILNIYRKIWYLTIVNAINAIVVVGGSLLFGSTLTRFATVWVIGEVFNILLFTGGAVYILSNKAALFNGLETAD